MARTVERSWVPEDKKGVEEPTLVEMYFGLELEQIAGYEERIKSTLMGKPLENDQAVFVTVREFMVARLVHHMKLQGKEFDALQRDDLDGSSRMYWRRLADSDGETAVGLVEFCSDQIEVLALEGQFWSSEVAGWRRAKEALERYVEKAEEELLAGSEKEE